MSCPERRRRANNPPVFSAPPLFSTPPSMADLPELEFLVDAFPHYPRLELASRLLCAASPEVLFNELAVENSSTSKNSQPSEAARGFPPEVTALAELFPSAHKDSLAAALQQNGGCMDKTIEALLEHQPVHRLAAVSGLPEPELRPYVARHKHDVLRALADVIAQYRRRTRVRTSRVQARAGTALADRDTYVLNERSAAFVLLLESVWAEPALRGINFDFLRKLLVFFQGDVSRVLDVARLYIEAGSQAVTAYHSTANFSTVDVSTVYLSTVGFFHAVPLLQAWNSFLFMCPGNWLVALEHAENSPGPPHHASQLSCPLAFKTVAAKASTGPSVRKRWNYEK
ncbi:hypothetical protein METBIDRAFT_13504 [Metschnikowia bicuspidata var. bicuspidata NRRL YB-4993]|uniref:CUE domain-containing protein n=1 Tax=Metschnikowia bicuspidata var. bicuspidata NRRL YB-4993 TaxID=869754 RepID=A0A1A0H584_9ASCO|nr:hypothetical protein METBIDRAFT_13504 [Metschnikowia bicuspidata var. bicuspidata NRRL YB-4993]OBA19196.1 hypothetical protein METBIDRAFT_13504 [Metschnikowia bicuspidata var. bicuspidata NRRL YB-4993]